MRFHCVDRSDPWSFFVGECADRTRSLVSHTSFEERAALAESATVWCAQTFGLGGRWLRVSAIEIVVYDADDAFQFKLRWC